MKGINIPFSAAAIIGVLAGGAALPDGSQAQENSLAPIIVTATKEEQRLQDVPMSISAISEAELERRGAFDLLDIAASIPNVSFSYGNGEGRTESRTLSLRGIYGPDTTGLYIDETPVDQSLPIKLVDVNRVEVLRGPQGTLYGARSMGGTVRIITNGPNLQNYEARVSGEVSGTQHGSENYNVEAMLNAPLSENLLAVRLTVYRDYLSGIFDRFYGAPGDTSDSPVVVDKGTDATTMSGANFSLRFTPTDRLTITPRLIYQIIDQAGASLADTHPDNFVQIRHFNLPEPLTDRLTHSSVEVTADLGWGQFVSSTSYFKRYNKQTEDYSDFVASAGGLGLPTQYPAEATVADEESRITQEARIRTAFLSRFKLILGLYYQKKTIDSVFYSTSPGIDEFYSTQVLGLPPGSTTFGTDNLFSAADTTKVRDRAVFGELTIDLTSRLSSILGARLFDSTNFLDRYADGIFNGGPSHDLGNQREHGVNPKYSLEYKLSDDAMIYTTAAKGFRSGGVNTHTPKNLCAADLARLGLTNANIDVFNSDQLWNYEIGAKSSWLDNRLTLNGALFYIDWTNLIQDIRFSCGFGIEGNIGAARSQGFELEATARPTPRLNVSFGAGYTDAQITASAPTLDAQAGDRIQQVPRWNVSGSAQYSVPVAHEHMGFIRGDGQYVSKSFTTFDQMDLLHTRDPYTIFNFQSGVTGDDWEVALFARNAFNEHANFSDTKSIAAELPGRPRISTNRPRTIGISVSKSF